MPSNLHVEDLDASAILAFLGDLERRGRSVRTRNARLAAIRSLFRFVMLRDPESIAVASRVLAIPIKKTENRIVGYLTRPEVCALLEAPDRGKWTGRRDHALLLTFYNTGARLSELTSLTRDHVIFGGRSFVHLHGKGRKDREVPLWSNTARVLQSWFHEIRTVRGEVAFPSARGAALSADGVSYIVKQTLKIARRECPSLENKRVTPHVLRHTTAMHLLQSGVDISVIALWLGHESIETTHVYVEADMATKERALEKLSPPESSGRRFKADDALLSFLARL
jgi:site-specific recombinase XerD